MSTLACLAVVAHDPHAIARHNRDFSLHRYSDLRNGAWDKVLTALQAKAAACGGQLFALNAQGLQELHRRRWRLESPHGLARTGHP